MTMCETDSNGVVFGPETSFIRTVGVGNIPSRGYCRVPAVGMVISPAMAAHFAPPSESSGGATALSIILGTGIFFFFVYLGRKKWRERQSTRDDGGE